MPCFIEHFRQNSFDVFNMREYLLYVMREMMRVLCTKHIVLNIQNTYAYYIFTNVK